MADRWFVFLDGVISGPYEEERLRQMISNGEISISDKICREGESLWRTIPEYHEFDDQLYPDSEVELSFDAPDHSSGNGQEQEYCPDNRQNGVISGKKYPDAVDQVFLGENVRLSCPNCWQHYRVKYNLCQGQVISCQECGKRFVLNLTPEIIKKAEESGF